MENKPIKEEEEEATNPYNYKLLDLIPKWVMKSEDGGGGGPRVHQFPSNEQKLELRLGLPGVEEEEEEIKPKKREGYNGNYSQTHNRYPLSLGYVSSQPCNSRMVELHYNDKKNRNFPSSSANTDVPNTSHKRAAPGVVVGWPPVRSSRRNLASSSSAKPVPDPPRTTLAPPVKAHENPTEKSHKGLFVKINMEGVPIGRKVDLNAYNNYDKLCSAVDTLFRGLLAAQMDSYSCGVKIKQDREKPITILLDGSGEYMLVYEDNEGDRMLVGDVPWNMFVSTVKRLRVLKSSELPSVRKFGGEEGKQLKGE